MGLSISKRIRDHLSLVRRILKRSKHVHIASTVRLSRGVSLWASESLRIADFVSIGPYSMIEVNGRIGEFTLISHHVKIVGRRDHDFREVGMPVLWSRWIGDRHCDQEDRVYIDRDVWIGAGAVILSGLHIGQGAMVAAGAVVVRDVEPYAVVAGNPAVRVSWRFSEKDRAMHSRLLKERLKGTASI